MNISEIESITLTKVGSDVLVTISIGGFEFDLIKEYCDGDMTISHSVHKTGIIKAINGKASGTSISH